MVCWVPYVVRLSTIVWADMDNKALQRLCYRIRRKREKTGCIVKPIVVIDIVPDVHEQKVASGFLDFFVPFPDKTVCHPEFVFRDGIRTEDLRVFFDEYKRNVMGFYSRFFRLVECG